MNASDRFYLFKALCKLKRRLRQEGIDPNGQFKVVSDYGYGDRYDDEPQSLKDAIKNLYTYHYHSEIEYDIGVFERDRIHHIEPCKYGWY